MGTSDKLRTTGIGLWEEGGKLGEGEGTVEVNVPQPTLRQTVLSSNMLLLQTAAYSTLTRYLQSSLSLIEH